ncbi:hypothetical protein A8C75_09025 [Marinobacterium aestuarii]|uniref:DUF7281 domain-containing protein n=1 Tax=Marinobacterium aestuarii TaxID=1821621 RepID=A0A1A9EXZ7_9GAMM|nr:hypothetical protein [Marinobacterium aestuarii]ANG62610.1 hypothetical protein A8C75_09025 [Marinobacterium aestuarii]
MTRALQPALTRLLQSENEQISASQLTSSQRRALDDFRVRTGSIVQQSSGRGSVYRIVNRAVIEQHLHEQAPLANTRMDDALPQRAANIGRARSSKIGQHAHELYYLLLKARGPVVWYQNGGQCLDLESVTRQQGAAVFAIGGETGQGWYTEGPLWLVENQALFDQLDWLPGDQAATVVWYSGQLRTSFIEWLAQRPRASTIHMFPDYDGVGLHNYLRLKLRLGDQVSFWLMPQWEHKLQRFGSNTLWQATARDFHAALPGLQPIMESDKVLNQLVIAMQSQGLALEQEAVWLEA